MRGDRVIIVGGGIAGASAAFHLAAGGADVVVVDDARAGRATAAGAGIVGLPWRNLSTPRAQLQRRSVEAYDAIAAVTGAPFDHIGQLLVAPPGPLLDEAETALASAPGGPAQRLTPDEARAAFPFLAPELGALRVPGTARVEGDVLRAILMEAAATAGAMVVSGPAVLEADAGGRRVTGVSVGSQRFTAPDVIVAAGAWSAQLVAGVGVDLPVAPQRGQILHLGVAGATDSLPVVTPLDRDNYLLPFPDHRVVVGATRETGSGFVPHLTAGGIAEVLTDALAVAPGLATAGVRDQRVGLRPATPDGIPLLGPVPGMAGLWVATGMGPQGLTLAPYCGRLLADAVLGKDSELDLAPYSPGRAMTDS